LVVGVSYKPDVLDTRESPALEIIDRLAREGAHVEYWDALVPSFVTPAGRRLHSVDPLAAEADLVLVHTLHRDADHGWLYTHPLVLDTTYRLDHPQRYVLRAPLAGVLRQPRPTATAGRHTHRQTRTA